MTRGRCSICCFRPAAASRHLGSPAVLLFLYPAVKLFICAFSSRVFLHEEPVEINSLDCVDWTVSLFCSRYVERELFEPCWWLFWELVAGSADFSGSWQKRAMPSVSLYSFQKRSCFHATYTTVVNSCLSVVYRPRHLNQLILTLWWDVTWRHVAESLANVKLHSRDRRSWFMQTMSPLEKMSL